MTGDGTKGRVWGTIPKEVKRIKTLDLLAPRFRVEVVGLLEDMEAAGHPAVVFETFRTQERQLHLYGFGRWYDDGRGIVTYSQDADDTWHGFGLAADIIHATLQWSAPAPFWTALGHFARRRHLLWGGDWNNNGMTTDERFSDRPHVQWGPPMRRSPSPRAAKLRLEGGLVRVWQEVRAAA